MEKKLQEFLHSPLKGRWLHSEKLAVYVRKGHHAGDDDKLHTYLDIANVSVDSKYQNQGHFKTFLALCQRISPYDGLLLENVHSEILRDYFRRLAAADPRRRESGMSFYWERAM